MNSVKNNTLLVNKSDKEKAIMLSILLCDDYLDDKGKMLKNQTEALVTALWESNGVGEAFEGAMREFNDNEQENDNDSKYTANNLFSGVYEHLLKSVIAYEELIENPDKADWEKTVGFKQVRIIVLYTHSDASEEENKKDKDKEPTIGSNNPRTDWSVQDIANLLKHVADPPEQGTLHVILLGCRADRFMRKIKDELDPYSSGEKYTFYAYSDVTYSIPQKDVEVKTQTEIIIGNPL